MHVFRFGTEGILLFQSWRLSSIAVLVAACVVTFVLTAMYEGLKTFRVWLVTRPLRLLIKRESQSSSPHSTSDALVEAADKLDNNKVSQQRFLQLSASSTKNTRNKILVLQTVLHVIQVFVGYVLMLIVMTYDAWLGLAVVSGAGIGYLTFAAVFPDDLRIRGAGSQGFNLVDRKCENSLLSDQ